MTVALRAFTRASKEISLPSRHRSTVMVSPGITGAEKRAWCEKIWSGSKSVIACSTARQVMP